MKLLSIFRKTGKIKETSSFSDFFLHSSQKEKFRVFQEAARRANEDQRELVEEYKRMRSKTT